MSDARSLFTDLNVDPVVGAEIMNLLSFNIDDLHDNVKFSQLKDVVRFLAPYEDRKWHIMKLTAGKVGLEKLDNVWSWVKLQREKEQHMESLQEIAQRNPIFDETTTQRVTSGKLAGSYNWS